MQQARRAAALAAIALAAIVTGSACRPLTIQTEPGPVYMVDVRNTFNEPMIVRFDDGSGARLLGTVAAGGTERFVVASPNSPSITILAVSENGGRQLSIQVQLQLGAAVPVVLT
ncbi:MAG TPA: hypothetical protein VNZ57_16215 [Longimicrobiales bacterium]|nr:hypothetical protein [Longimicrobiales bacterium]